MSIEHANFTMVMKMKIDPIYLDAIIRANKLGAIGVQVIGAYLPDRATEDYKVRLVSMTPLPRTATQREWFDE